MFTEISVHNEDIDRVETEIVALQLQLDDVTAPTDLATTSFIKFDGVDGESTESSHEQWSDLLSFGQGQHSPDAGGTGESRRRGAAIVEDVTLSKELDKASPKIAEAVLKGKVFPKVEIEVTSTYGEEQLTYYRYELTNVLVTSYNISGGDGSVPTEDFSLNFEEIKVTYTEREADGSKKGNVEYEWKVEEGES